VGVLGILKGDRCLNTFLGDGLGLITLTEEVEEALGLIGRNGEM